MELLVIWSIAIIVPLAFAILQIFEQRKEIQMLLEITDKQSRLLDIINREVGLLNQKSNLLKEEIDERLK